MKSAKTVEEKIAVMQHYANGGKIIVDGQLWTFKEPPLFNWEVCEYDIAVIYPSIDWSHVNEEYKFLAIDEVGDAYLYTERPRLSSSEWELQPFTKVCRANIFTSFDPGHCHWEDSLISRI